MSQGKEAEPEIGDALNRPAGVPAIALSVRQPWAWALVYGGKDIENRSEPAVRNGGMRAQIGQRIAIHASKGMTRDEYESGRSFMASIGVACPAACDLERGGIIGSGRLETIFAEHASPWFFGPRGLWLRQMEPVPFIGASGELGMFAWAPNFAQPEAPARWMATASSASPHIESAPQMLL